MPSFDSKNRTAVAVLVWAVLYWAAAYLSLLLDDPLEHVGFVWFPAGIGVAAFLLSEYRRWPWLLLAFFIAQLTADINFDHDVTIAVVLALISLASDMGTAWLVRRYAQHKDGLQIVMRWIVATFATSAVAAVVSAGWLTWWDDTPFDQLVWVWWGAHASGVLYLSAVVMGLRGYEFGRTETGAKGLFVGVVALVLMSVCAWLMFDAELANASSRSMPWRAPLVFALTGVPIVLAVIAAIACGNRMGSLALLCLGAIVIFHSSQGTGPFFYKSLQPGESLLLAQCYLVGTALLVVFLRVFTQSVKRYGALQEKSQETAYMYRLNTADGHMDWDGRIHEALATDEQSTSSVSQLLSMAHPDDRTALATMLTPGGSKANAKSTRAFRLRSPSSDWIAVRVSEPVLVSDSEKAILVGTWFVERGGQA